MSEQQYNNFLSVLMTVIVGSSIVCVFFWISSCQRTDIITACLAHVPDAQKTGCIK